MSTKSNKKLSTYSTIAAICYVIISLNKLIVIINTYKYLSDLGITNGIFLKFGNTGISFFTYLDLCISVVTAIALFLKSKKLLIIVFTICSLLDIYSIFTYFSFLKLLSTVFIDFSTLALIILTLKNNKLVKKMWYIPSLYRLLIFLLFFIKDYDFSAHAYFLIEEFVLDYSRILRLFFMGLWLKEHFVADVEQNNEYITFNHNAINTSLLDEKILVKSKSQKNKNALTLYISGLILICLSNVVSTLAFNYLKGTSDYGSKWKWCLIYFSFSEFFTKEFFNISCFYGYLFLIGIILTIIGVVIKFKTENCEVTITSQRFIGKLPHSNEIIVPLKEITNFNQTQYSGISISTRNKLYVFYCIENREEIIKALAFLCKNVQPSSLNNNQTPKVTFNRNMDDADKIKQLKQLLDAGVISQVEFDQKKKEILNL